MSTEDHSRHLLVSMPYSVNVVFEHRMNSLQIHTLDSIDYSFGLLFVPLSGVSPFIKNRTASKTHYGNLVISAQERSVSVLVTIALGSENRLYPSLHHVCCAADPERSALEH